MYSLFIQNIFFTLNKINIENKTEKCLYYLIKYCTLREREKEKPNFGEKCIDAKSH